MSDTPAWETVEVRLPKFTSVQWDQMLGDRGGNPNVWKVVACVYASVKAVTNADSGPVQATTEEQA